MVLALMDATTYPAVENCADAGPGCGEYFIAFPDRVVARSYTFFLFVVTESTQDLFGQGSVTVVPGLASTFSTVESLSPTYIAGGQGSFLIYARDQYLNQLTVGGEQFSVTVIPDDFFDMNPTVEDLGIGTYQVKAST